MMRRPSQSALYSAMMLGALLSLGVGTWLFLKTPSESVRYIIDCFDGTGKLLYRATSQGHPTAYRAHRHTCVVTTEREDK